MNKIVTYFKSKTAEQVFSLCLLITFFIVIIFCSVVRLCGCLWFSADIDFSAIPSQFWQDRIMNFLLMFELTFVYKILCRTKWIWCILISSIQTFILIFINNIVIANILNIILYFLIPLFFQRKWFTILDSFFMYAINIIYCGLFLVGRIGDFENANINFIYSILGMLDYKLFIVSLFLFQINFGGFKLWKKQKQLICQIDLKTLKK